MANDPQFKRALIESFKYLSAKELLLVLPFTRSRLWHRLSQDEEIWGPLIGPAGLQYRGLVNPTPSNQDIYKALYHKVCYAIKHRCLYRYVVPKDTWSSSPIDINWDIDPATATIFIPKDRLFGVPPPGSSYPFLLSISSGRLERLPALSPPRQYPGICLYQGFVYAFAGGRSKKCERFDLQSRHWSALPDCLEELQAFNPVVTPNLIYLPNGSKDGIETFDPETQIFTLLECRTGMTNSASSIIIYNKLLILGMLGLFEVDIDTQESKKVDFKKSLRSAWSTYNPILCGEELALVWTYNESWTIACFNVNSLETRYVDIPESIR